MEQLVQLNDDLMKSNGALQAQAQQNFQACQTAETKIQKLQKDLTFYINKANTLEHAKNQSQAQTSPQKHYAGASSQMHEDTKMSKSLKVRGSNYRNDNSPFVASASGPMEELQPVVRQQNSSKLQQYRASNETVYQQPDL